MAEVCPRTDQQSTGLLVARCGAPSCSTPRPQGTNRPRRSRETAKWGSFYIFTHVFAGKKDTHPAFEVRVLGAAACRWWRWRRSARGLTNSPPDCWSRAAARRPVRRRAPRAQTDPAEAGRQRSGEVFIFSHMYSRAKKTRTPLLRCASWKRQLAAGGDGGSRTRVRKRVPAAFYERSRALKIPLESHRTAGNLLR